MIAVLIIAAVALVLMAMIVYNAVQEMREGEAFEKELREMNGDLEL